MLLLCSLSPPKNETFTNNNNNNTNTNDNVYGAGVATQSLREVHPVHLTYADHFCMFVNTFIEKAVDRYS